MNAKLGAPHSEPQDATAGSTNARMMHVFLSSLLLSMLASDAWICGVLIAGSQTSWHISADSDINTLSRCIGLGIGVCGHAFIGWKAQTSTSAARLASPNDLHCSTAMGAATLQSQIMAALATIT